MPSQRTRKRLLSVLAVGCAGLLAVTLASAAPSKGAGLDIPEGGYLRAEYDKPFDNHAEGVTVEGWFYFDAPPLDKKPGVLWVKPGSYGVFLSGRMPLNGRELAHPPGTVTLDQIWYRSASAGRLNAGGRGDHYEPGMFPLHRWLHVSVGSIGVRETVRTWTHIDGVTKGANTQSYALSNHPLLVGGMDESLSFDPHDRWLPHAGSIRGKVAAIRVSRGVRYRDDEILPKYPFREDHNTVAHWELGRTPAAAYPDLSGNGRVLRSHGPLSVKSGGKATTLWAQLRARAAP